MINKYLKNRYIFVYFLILISPLFNISKSEASSKKSYLEVKKYLKDLKTLSADFIQISNDGSIRKSDKGIIAITDKPARNPSARTKLNNTKKPFLKLRNSSLKIRNDDVLFCLSLFIY